MMEQNEQVEEKCVSDIKELLRYYEMEMDCTDFFVSKKVTEAYKRYLFFSQEKLEKLLERL